MKYKESLNNIYAYIKVLAKDIKITYGQDQSTVSFLQMYESDKFRAKGIKTIKLIREAAEWKIYRENWIN